MASLPHSELVVPCSVETNILVSVFYRSVFLSVEYWEQPCPTVAFALSSIGSLMDSRSRRLGLARDLTSAEEAF